MATRSYTHMSLAVVFMATLVLLSMPCCIRSDITCDRVYSALKPCAFYVTMDLSNPSSGCCDGVRSMVAAGQTTHDRRTICGCLITEAARHPRDIRTRAAGVPAKCHVSLPFQISAYMDCNTIS